MRSPATAIEPAASTAPETVVLRAPESAAAVHANARAIAPLAAAHAAETERLGRLAPAVAEAMRAGGLFQMAFPARCGGLEMTVADQVEIVALVASADASAAWHVGVLNATGYYAARLEPSAYAALYPTRDAPTAGSFHPRGRAVAVEGGYLVSGRWDWGSGAAVATHIVGGCLVEDADGTQRIGSNGRQRHLGLWLPRAAIASAGNWQTIGLRGSGSASFAIDDPVFVPGEFSFDREAGVEPDADPLNRTPLIAHYALGGVVVGIARRLVEVAGAALRDRRQRGADDAPLRQALGEAMGEVDFAIAGMRATAQRTDRLIFTPGAEFTELDEARMTAANALTAAALRRVLPVAMEVAGSNYVFDRHPIERVIRDAIAALAHSGTRRAHLAAWAATALDDPSADFTVSLGAPLASVGGP